METLKLTDMEIKIVSRKKIIKITNPGGGYSLNKLFKEIDLESSIFLILKGKKKNYPPQEVGIPGKN